VFALGDSVAAEEIDGASLCGGGEPGAGIFGDAGLRPLFEGGDEGFLGEVFGEADVTGLKCVSPAMTRARSMRQTASMVRW
jgi:hypothetical protein